MNYLKPFLPFSSDESVLSWTTRLAGLHTGDTLVPFLNDIGIKLTNLLKGDDEVIERLVEVTGIEAEKLRRNMPRQVSQRRYELRGNAFSVELFRGNFTGFCPACLAEDDQAGDPKRFRRGRLTWWFRPVRTCRLHQLQLVDRKRTRWNDVAKEMSLIVPERGADLLRLADCTVSRVPSELQDYVERRLKGLPGPAWLDGQDIDQAVRATEMLGVALALPPRVNLNRITAEDWEIAARAGYHYTSKGEDGIREALSDCLDTVRARMARTIGYGPQLAFGRLYQWLEFSKNTKDVGPIKGVVERFAMETLTYSKGKNLLENTRRERTIYSINALANENGLHPNTLRNLLVSRSVIDGNKKYIHPGSFDLTAAKSVVKIAKEAVAQNALPAYMKTTRGQVIMLLEAGIIQKINASGHNIGSKCRGVSVSVVDAFLADLHRHAVDFEEIPAGMFDIPGTAQKARVTGDIIIGMILAHEVKRIVRRTGEQGYGAIYLDPEEVCAVYDPVRPIVPMTAADAGRAIGVPAPVVVSFLTEWEGLRLLQGTKHGHHKRAMINVEEVERFKRTYVTLFNLVCETGIHHIKLNRILRERNVKPVINPELISVSVYCRSDIPNDLAAPAP